MVISCLIIEDDLSQNQKNKAVLQEHFNEISPIDQAYSINEADKLLKQKQYDFILVDVHLGDGIVMDLFSKQENLNSKLIFTTSYSEYAVEAFKFSAISYLLKPYSKEELINEVSKTLQRINQENYHKQLEVLFHNIQSSQKEKRIVLKNHDLIHVVNIEDIFYAQADNNYTHFFCTEDRKILVSKSLKTFEEQLAPESFFRCHHSYLINLKKVKAIHKSEDAVILSNEATIPIASSKKKMLYSLIG